MNNQQLFTKGAFWASLALIGAYFMPWFQASMFSGSGFQITQYGNSIGKETYLLALLPLCGLLIILDLARHAGQPTALARAGQVGILVVTGLLLYKLVDLGLFEAEEFYQLFAIGFYLTLAAALYLAIDLLKGLSGPPPSPPSQHGPGQTHPSEKQEAGSGPTASASNEHSLQAVANLPASPSPTPQSAPIEWRLLGQKVFFGLMALLGGIIAPLVRLLLDLFQQVPRETAALYRDFGALYGFDQAAAKPPAALEATEEQQKS